MLFIMDSELGPLTNYTYPPSSEALQIAAIVSAINSPIDLKSPSKMGLSVLFFSIITFYKGPYHPSRYTWICSEVLNE